MLAILFNILIIFCIIYVIKQREYHESFNNYNTPIKYKLNLINLDRNVDRLLLINKQCQRENINMVRFPAIYGKDLDEKQLIKDGTLYRLHSLHKGELGCAISHITLLSKLYQTLERDEYGVIFEDDVIIPPQFNKKLTKIIRDAPDNWDILYLGGCNIKGAQHPPYFIKPTVNLPSSNLCAHAYVVRRDTIPKLLSYLTPLYRPIDSQWRNYFKDMNVFFVNPNLVVQNKEIRSIRRDIDGLPQSKYWKKHQTDITVLNDGD
jgi:glycosyl transferase family 25